MSQLNQDLIFRQAILPSARTVQLPGLRLARTEQGESGKARQTTPR
jgi:hypothetical protein